MAIVARTVKGWGAADEQGMGKHGTPVKKDKLPAKFSANWIAPPRIWACSITSATGELKIRARSPPRRRPARRKPIKIKSFADGLAAVGMDKDLAAGKPIAPRKAYGAALVALGEADKRVIGLDADVKNSTHAEWFAKKFPAQYLECKIAEQNMISVAAGAARRGKIPFCSTFAKFVDAGLRPGGDGDHRRGEPENHRHPRRRDAGRRWTQPDVPARTWRSSAASAT